MTDATAHLVAYVAVGLSGATVGLGVGLTIGVIVA